MKVSGASVLHAAPDKVWATINDPKVLADVIPGCQSLDEVGESHYKGVVSMGIASIKGTYSGEIKLEDLVQPTSLTLRAAGAGSPGTVDTTVAVVLTDLGDGTTKVSYDADAIVGGMVGGVGQRVLTSVAKKTAGAFFSQIDDVLTGKKSVRDKASPAAVAAADGSAAGGPGASRRIAAVAPSGGGFVVGAAVGALAMLAGVLVGSRITRRH